MDNRFVAVTNDELVAVFKSSQGQVENFSLDCSGEDGSLLFGRTKAKTARIKIDTDDNRLIVFDGKNVVFNIRLDMLKAGRMEKTASYTDILFEIDGINARFRMFFKR